MIGQDLKRIIDNLVNNIPVPSVDLVRLQRTLDTMEAGLRVTKPNAEVHITNFYNPHLVRGGQILAETNGDWSFGGPDTNNTILFWDDSISTLKMRRANQDFFTSTTTVHTFNPSGFDTDFIIEGATDPNLFNLDAGTNRIGISTATPTDTLEVAGTFRVSGSQSVFENNVYLLNNIPINWQDSALSDHALLVLDSSDIFTINPNGDDIDIRVEGDTDIDLIYVDAGNDRVGISTATPSVLFEVGGATKFDGASEVTGTLTLGSFVYMPNATSFYFKNNIGVNYRWIEFDSSNIFNINPAGVSYDSRIQGNTDANLIYVDASADRVGIGTATPGQKLEVNGAILVPNDISVYGKNTGGTARNLIKLGTSDNILIGDNSGTGTDQWYAGGSIVLRVDGNTSSLNMLGLYSTPILVFNDGGQDMDMRFESVSLANSMYFDGNNGRLSIGGTSTPSTELHLYNSGSNARPILTFEHDGDNALGGFILFRHKRTTGSTASANDVAGTLRWQAYDSTATPVEQQYLTMQGRIISTGSGYVEGQLRIFAMDTAGSNNIVLQLGRGIQLGGAPTGGDKGLGTINLVSGGNLYLNNSAYTNPDYVLEHWVTGSIEKFKDKPGAENYKHMTLEQMEDYIVNNLRLPGIDDSPSGIFDRADISLELIERLYTYIIELNHKLNYFLTGGKQDGD